MTGLAKTILVPRSLKASFGATIVDMAINPEPFGSQFSGDSWTAWRVLLAVSTAYPWTSKN